MSKSLAAESGFFALVFQQLCRVTGKKLIIVVQQQLRSYAIEFTEFVNNVKWIYLTSSGFH